MRSQLSNLMDDIVLEYAERGEGTGGASKILSWFTGLILTMLAVQLIKDQQYIPLAVIAILVWTKFSFLAIPGVAIYFIFTQYWIGVGLLAGYFIISILSIKLGTTNIRRLLLSGKPMISPFESMPVVLWGFVLECLFLALALFTHGWISVVPWCLFGIIVLYHIGRYWFRLRPRWGQIHYPIMIRYASCAGSEAFLAEREQRDFNFEKVTQLLLKSVYPSMEEEDIEKFIDSVLYKIESFADYDILKQTIVKRNPSVSQDIVATVLRKTEEHLQSHEGTKLIVLYAIAEIIESVFGINERGNYLLAVIEGKAQ